VRFCRGCSKWYLRAAIFAGVPKVESSLMVPRTRMVKTDQRRSAPLGSFSLSTRNSRVRSSWTFSPP
jgi:hypothetical protein